MIIMNKENNKIIGNKDYEKNYKNLEKDLNKIQWKLTKKKYLNQYIYKI